MSWVSFLSFNRSTFYETVHLFNHDFMFKPLEDLFHLLNTSRGNGNGDNPFQRIKGGDDSQAVIRLQNELQIGDLLAIYSIISCCCFQITSFLYAEPADFDDFNSPDAFPRRFFRTGSKTSFRAVSLCWREEVDSQNITYNSVVKLLTPPRPWIQLKVLKSVLVEQQQKKGKRKSVFKRVALNF